MKNIVKSRKKDSSASASLISLPDEIILQILNKLIDLKTLCFCYLVSRRFSSIVLQVDAISLTVPLINPRTPPSNALRPIVRLFGESFIPAYKFLDKFKGVKSLCIQLPSSSEIGIDNRHLLKWKVKFGTRIESFIFLSPNSISDKDGFRFNGYTGEEENNESVDDMYNKIFHIALKCLKDAMVWHLLLLDLVKDLPMLEKVSITDSGRRGRLSLSGKRLSEVKEWLHSASETELNRVEVPDMVQWCYVPVLKLRVSGYMLKEIFFGVMEMKDTQGGYDDLMKSEDGFENEEGAAYTEAVVEILEKHRGTMFTMVVDGGVV